PLGARFGLAGRGGTQSARNRARASALPRPARPFTRRQRRIRAIRDTALHIVAWIRPWARTVRLDSYAVLRRCAPVRRARAQADASGDRGGRHGPPRLSVELAEWRVPVRNRFESGVRSQGVGPSPRRCEPALRTAERPGSREWPL